MRYLYWFVIMLLIMPVTTISAAESSQDYAKTIEFFKSSPEVREFFDSAYGYAVFPTVGKGAFVIGVAHGAGKVYHGGAVTGITTMTHVSIGLQAGGQGFSQIIFFQDKRAYDEFTSGSFEFEAGASAVAVTASAQAQTGTKGNSAGLGAGPASGRQADIDYNKGMAVFVHAKGGFMLEAAIGGQKFSFKPL